MRIFKMILHFAGMPNINYASPFITFNVLNETWYSVDNLENMKKVHE